VGAASPELSTTWSDLLDSSQIKSEGTELKETTATAEADIPDLDADQWVAELYYYIENALDNTRIGDMSEVPVEGFLGLVDPNEPDLTGFDTSDAVFDPQHAVGDQNDKPDEWVVTETDARRKIQQGIQRPIYLGQIGIKEIHKLDKNANQQDVTMETAQ